MAKTQLLFERGIPDSVKRLVNPDAIAEVVFSNTRSMTKGWSSHAKLADQIVQGKKRGWLSLFEPEDPIVTSGVVQDFLYGQESMGLSRKEWQYLDLLKDVRAMGEYSNEPRRNVKFNKDDIKKALKKLAEQTKKEIFPKLRSELANSAKRAAPKIELLCKQIYGEDCSSGEGQLIFLGDLEKAYQLGVLRTSPPGSDKVLGRLFEILKL